MNTLLRENILQLANRLQQKQQIMYAGDSAETVLDRMKEETPPPSADASLSPPCASSSSPSLSLSQPSTTSNTSPWIRNAGRKKSHPVWDFFRDLKGENGSTGVECIYCGWNGDDRSPNNLRTHLKKNHSHDGIFHKFSEKLAITPTQPYVKRVRAGGSQHTEENKVNLSEVMNGALSFLDAIPRIDEVINITARLNEDDTNGETNTETSWEHRSSSSPSSDPPSSSPCITSNPFTSIINPLLYMNAMNALSAVSHPPSSLPPFFLNDGSCVSLLMKMTVDLDLSLCCHGRNGETEISFERRVDKGRSIVLVDMGRQMKVMERLNGKEIHSEMWTKTDLVQFNWAIRGKCVKVLHK